MAKENGLDIELVETSPSNGVSEEYLKLNKLGKVPTFEGADGFVLTEAIAIAVYCTYHPLVFYVPSFLSFFMMRYFFIQLSLSELQC